MVDKTSNDFLDYDETILEGKFYDANDVEVTAQNSMVGNSGASYSFGPAEVASDSSIGSFDAAYQSLAEIAQSLPDAGIEDVSESLFGMSGIEMDLGDAGGQLLTEAAQGNSETGGTLAAANGLTAVDQAMSGGGSLFQNGIVDAALNPVEITLEDRNEDDDPGEETERTADVEGDGPVADEDAEAEPDLDLATPLGDVAAELDPVEAVLGDLDLAADLGGPGGGGDGGPGGAEAEPDLDLATPLGDVAAELDPVEAVLGDLDLAADLGGPGGGDGGPGGAEAEPDLDLATPLGDVAAELDPVEAVLGDLDLAADLGGPGGGGDGGPGGAEAERVLSDFVLELEQTLSESSDETDVVAQSFDEVASDPGFIMDLDIEVDLSVSFESTIGNIPVPEGDLVSGLGDLMDIGLGGNSVLG